MDKGTLEMIKLSPKAIEFLCLQRTQYADLIERKYNEELALILYQITKNIPTKIDSVAEIGGGIGGLSVLLHEHYGCEINFLEKNCLELEKRLVGFGSSEDFGGYTSKAVAEDTWNSSLYRKVTEVEPTKKEPRKNLFKFIDVDKKFKYPSVDLTISLLSWGFHYPLNTYWEEAVKNSKYIIADCRINAEEIPMKDKAVVISVGRKHQTILWKLI